MTHVKRKVRIVGAGVAGLAASIRMAALGLDVEVFESNGFPGGKLSEIQLGAYRFDAGPSLFTMPHLVEELFWISGKNAQSFEYRQLEEVCRYFFPDGTGFHVPAGEQERLCLMAERLGESKEVLQKYLSEGRFKYETIGKLFLERCLRKPSTFWNKKAFQAYAQLGRLGLFSSLHALNAARFQNPKTVQIFDRYATYNGSDPYQTPAVMSMIPHLEFGIGAFFPKGGMHQITTALYQLACEQGVRFRFDAPVSALETEGNRVIGLRLGDQFFATDVLISAIDVSQTYQLLPNQQKARARYSRLPKSTSAIIWYWGIRKTDDRLGLHNLFFSSDYQKEFRQLFQSKTMPEEPTIYLNISSKMRPEDAPDGGENWFVMVNAPANEGQDWERILPEARSTVLRLLTDRLGWNPEDFLETETFLDPVRLEKRTGAQGGALYGSNSNSPFAAFLRHANFSSTFSNLFFCGGTVHPGGGIPLALQSAALAESYIRERFGL